MDAAAQEAWQIMMDNRHVLDRLTTVLLEKETVLEGELKEIFADIVKAPERELWLSSADRPVSDIPPVPMPESDKELVEDSEGAGSSGHGTHVQPGPDLPGSEQPGNPAPPAGPDLPGPESPGPDSTGPTKDQL